MSICPPDLLSVRARTPVLHSLCVIYDNGKGPAKVTPYPTASYRVGKFDGDTCTNNQAKA